MNKSTRGNKDSQHLKNIVSRRYILGINNCYRLFKGSCDKCAFYNLEKAECIKPVQIQAQLEKEECPQGYYFKKCVPHTIIEYVEDVKLMIVVLLAIVLIKRYFGG